MAWIVSRINYMLLRRKLMNSQLNSFDYVINLETTLCLFYADPVIVHEDVILWWFNLLIVAR